MPEERQQQAKSPWRRKENIRLLRELTYFYLYRSHNGPGGLPLTELSEKVFTKLYDPKAISAMDDENRTKNANATYSYLRRFIFYDTSVQRFDHIINALGEVIIGWFYKKKNLRTQLIQEMEDIGLFDYFEARANEKTERPEPDELPDAPGPWLADTFNAFFQTDNNDFRRAAKSLTGRDRCKESFPTNDDRQGFETYRYSSESGNMIKTFTIITPPSEDIPHCSFRNFYQNDESGATKEARGVVVRLNSGIYFLGRINEGDAIKLMVFPTAAMRSKLLTGLVATVNSDGNPLMARVVMKRTDAKHSDAVSPQIIPADKLRDEVDLEIIRRARNRIGFYIGNTVYSKSNKRYISSRELVEMCRGHFSEDLELYEKPFNPASHAQYPFNQALVCFSNNEDRE